MPTHFSWHAKRKHRAYLGACGVVRMSETLFQKATIIGLGQMGASLGLALKSGGLVGDIAGYDLHADHAEAARALGAIDTLSDTPEQAVTDADLIILCTPVGTYGALMQTIAAQLKEGATLTDIGSIKAQAIRDIMPHLPQHVRFIPSHPIAGSEKVGPYHAHAEFFLRHLFLISPIDGTPPEWVEPIAKLWHSTGAAVDLLPPELHDQIYACMSHLPQLMAFAAMPVLDSQPLVLRDDDDLFKRFIRIGRSDPEMWRDVFLENAEHVLSAAANVNAIVTHMKDELLLGAAKEKVTELDIPIERLCKVLWPRMLSSSMIAAVQLLEMQLEVKLAHYAAGGFTDVACPVAESTDEDFSAVSDHPNYMVKLLDGYLAQQKAITDAIEASDGDALLALLSECQAAGQKLVETVH
jgi:cyclohexadieny/prephenate dehydrogenase